MITTLIDEFIAELHRVGATSPFEDWARFEPATPADIDALAAEIGCALPDDLTAWLGHVSCELPLQGNYGAVSATRILENIRATREIDFSKHHANITSWQDGRFDTGQLADAYWLPQWIGVARDGCGNEYCVDLAPGPHGAAGQLLAMEFQDGQGPYLARWTTLETMLRAHLAKLTGGEFFVDEEGFIEFE